MLNIIFITLVDKSQLKRTTLSSEPQKKAMTLSVRKNIGILFKEMKRKHILVAAMEINAR